MRNDPSRPATSNATGARPKRGPAGERFEIGGFWLWYRTDRDDWNICWLDGRVTRRVASGVGGAGKYPPAAAREALVEHRATVIAKRMQIQAPIALPPGEVEIGMITSTWLEQHVAQLEAPHRYANSVAALERYWAKLRADGALPEPFVISSVTGSLIDGFIEFRRAEGASAPTISRDLAALRGPINWARDNNYVLAVPRIKDVKGRIRPRTLEWNPEQVAVILDAAAALESRRHVHLFTTIMLSTHSRVEAVLELDASQIGKGRINFLRPGEEQTKKRRAIVPICPTLAPWLAGIRGKVIVYRVPTSARTRAAGGGDQLERPTRDIKNAFAGVLLAAHEMRPDLGFAKQVMDERGKPVWEDARPGDTARRPKLTTIGSPNTLRHTIHTWHKTQGVPDAQIDAAAGHSEDGTGANYTHLRPEYLREFIASTESFWEAVGEFTSAHLRYQRDTKVASIASGIMAR